MAGKRRSTLRWIELVVILVVIVVGVLLALPVIHNTRYPVQLRTCQDNLRQWGTIFSMYSRENDWRWPMPHGFESFGAASNAPGCLNIDDHFDFSPDRRIVFPDYANDPLLYACPDAPGLLPPTKVGPVILKQWRLDPVTYGIAEDASWHSCAFTGDMTRGDATYTYLGWRIDPFDASFHVVTREEALEYGLPASGPANIVALLAHLQPTESRDFRAIQAERYTGIRPSRYLKALGTRWVEHVGNDKGDGITVPWHGAGILYQGLGEPAPFPWIPVTPIMWDTIHQDANGNPTFAHTEPSGVNVLYMDGHVEFKQYPGDVFPVVPSFATMQRVP